MERTLREIVRDAMTECGLNIKQLARRTTALGDPVSEGTVHNVLKDRVSHARYDTIRPLCHALGLDYNTVLADIDRPTRQTRSLSHELPPPHRRPVAVTARGGQATPHRQ